MPHAGNHRHNGGQRRRLVVTFASALARQISLFRAQRASPAPDGCRRAYRAVTCSQRRSPAVTVRDVSLGTAVRRLKLAGCKG
jgi:hypothetical protein